MSRGYSHSGCYAKTGFDSEKEAEDRLEEMKERGIKQKLYVYRCNSCGSYHFSRKKKVRH